MTSDRAIPAEASISGQDGLPPLPRDLLSRIDITVDGRPVYLCVAYSIPQGYVRTHVRESGRFKVDKDELVTARVDGVVQVVLKADVAVSARGRPNM